MLSGSGEVEEAEHRGWTLWSQVFGVDEDGIQSTSRSSGLWIDQSSFGLSFHWLLSECVRVCVCMCVGISL